MTQDAAEVLEPILLTAHDQEILAHPAERLVGIDLWAEPEAWVTEAQAQCASLSAGLRRQLRHFRRFGDPSGGLLLRGVPIGEVPGTPSSVEASDAARGCAAAAMSVLVACLGEQFGFRPEFGGRLVQDIHPVAGFEAAQISLGSTVDLECHIEMAFSDFRPDIVVLLCLRADHDCRAETTLHPVEALLPALDTETMRVLRQPRFRTKVDASFRLGDGGVGDVWVSPIPVFSGPAGRPHMRVDFAETEGLDEMACDMLDRLRAAALGARSVVLLEAGDLLVIDNHRALHGRSPFVPRYDGDDRWLLRSFVTRDLRPSESLRPGDGRIVDAEYEYAASGD